MYLKNLIAGNWIRKTLLLGASTRGTRLINYMIKVTKNLNCNWLIIEKTFLTFFWLFSWEIALFYAMS